MHRDGGGLGVKARNTGVFALLAGALVATSLAGSATAAYGALLTLTNGSGQIGQSVSIDLVLLEDLADFEGLDIPLYPDVIQYDVNILALDGAPSLRPGLFPDWVPVAPTEAEPAIGIVNPDPGANTLTAGVLATYRFLILPGAPSGPAAVSIPYVFGEDAPVPLSAEITVEAIPEPASTLLLGSGLALAGWLLRRFRASNSSSRLASTAS